MGERERLRTHGLPKTKEGKKHFLSKVPTCYPSLPVLIRRFVIDRIDSSANCPAGFPVITCTYARYKEMDTQKNNKKNKLWSTRKGWLSVVILPAAEKYGEACEYARLFIVNSSLSSYRNDVPFQGRRKEGEEINEGRDYAGKCMGKRKGEEMG